MFTHINWLLKSMYRLPSGVQKYTPLARATGMGSTADCAAHSKSVCAFESATISSPVIAIRATRRSLEHRLALGAKLVAGLPLRHLVGLRHAVADREVQLQIFA